MDTLRWVTVDRSVTGIALIASMVNREFVLASLCKPNPSGIYFRPYIFVIDANLHHFVEGFGQIWLEKKPGGYFQELEVAYAERVEKEVAMQTETRRLNGINKRSGSNQGPNFLGYVCLVLFFLTQLMVRYLLVWGPVVWIPGIPFMKGIVLFQTTRPQTSPTKLLRWKSPAKSKLWNRRLRSGRILEESQKTTCFQDFLKPFLWWWFQLSTIFFNVHPYFGKIPILTHMFQTGLKPTTRFPEVVASISFGFWTHTLTK